MSQINNQLAKNTREITNLLGKLQLNDPNTNMPNTPPLANKKRKSPNSNSDSNNNKQPSGIRKREVPLPPLIPGRGMGCQYAGMSRYMQRAKGRFNNAGIVPAYLDYNIDNNKYGITKNSSKIVNVGGDIKNARISGTNQVHLFMVIIRTVEKAHAISVLVDPNVYSRGFRVWVFDPHGQYSKNSMWGKTMRENVVPIITNLWDPSTKPVVRYYNGPNLQAGNNRGVCSTFYVTFMDYIPQLIAGKNINNITKVAAINNLSSRKRFLNYPPKTNNPIAKNITRMN